MSPANARWEYVRHVEWSKRNADRMTDRYWLHIEALSLNLDNVTAAQFAEYRGPYPPLTRQPREGS